MLWLKRNWLLLILTCLAVAGVVLSILLLFEPCEKDTEYSSKNVTTLENVTTLVNRSLTVNYTETVNVTSTVAENVTSTVVENVTTTERENVTTTEDVVTNVTTMSPVDVVVSLDSSNSVLDDQWEDESLGAASDARARVVFEWGSKGPWSHLAWQGALHDVCAWS